MDKRVDCHVSTCMSDNKPNLMSPMLTFYSTWKCSINKNVTRSCPKLRQHLWGLKFLLHNGWHMDVYPYSLHLWLIFLPTSTYWPCSSFGVKSKELSIVVGVWWHLQIHTFREWNLVFSVRHENMWTLKPWHLSDHYGDDVVLVLVPAHYMVTNFLNTISISCVSDKIMWSM